MRAIEAFDYPVVLLAGGSDKGTPFDELAQVACRQTKAAIVYGATAPKLRQAFEQASRQSGTASSEAISPQIINDAESALTHAVADAQGHRVSRPCHMIASH